LIDEFGMVTILRLARSDLEKLRTTADMRSVLDLVHHSFGWRGLGVEQTTAAFDRPGNKHKTGGETQCRCQSQNPRPGRQMLPRSDEKGTERGDATKDQHESDDQDWVPTGTGPLTRHAYGLPATGGGESCSS
jgi:hypothetical protein